MDPPFQSYTLQAQKRIVHPAQQPNAVSTVVYVRSNNIFNPEQMAHRRNGCLYTPVELQAGYCSNTFPRFNEVVRPHDISSPATYSGYPNTMKSSVVTNNHNVYTLPNVGHAKQNAISTQQEVPPNQCYRQFVFPRLNLKPEDKDSDDKIRDGQTMNNQTINRAENQTALRTTGSKITKQTVKLPLGCTGLFNLGNTCYMNSVLQCLSHTKFLVDYCMEQKQKQNTKAKNSKAILANALAEVFKQMWSGFRVYDPSDFRKKMLSFISGFSDDACQEDAQEFLLFLLESLHTDLKKVNLKKKHQSIRLFARCDKYADSAWKEYLGSENGVVVDIFMGQLRSSLTCTSCKQVSHTFEPAQGLSLPIPKAQNGTRVTLTDCLRHYFHKETLQADEKPACSVCNRKSDSTKCLSMQKFPKIFIIQLNRFSHNDGSMTKITTPVFYPVKNLNFKEFAYVDANVIYNLYAVVEHIGNLDNGHYMAIIKNRNNDKWYHYDDDHVRQIHESCVITENAYILFYELHSAEKEKCSSVATLNLKNLFIDKA